MKIIFSNRVNSIVTKNIQRKSNIKLHSKRTLLNKVSSAQSHNNTKHDNFLNNPPVLKVRTGICSLCRKKERLTFEHIPPRSAFNSAPAKPITISSFLKNAIHIHGILTD